MNYDNVFEIQFKEVWDNKYAWKIVKNNIDFKNTGGEIKLNNLKISSKFKDILYKFDESTYEWTILDDNILIDYSQKSILEDFVNYVNKKYFKPIRWRANKSDYYYYIDSYGDISREQEAYDWRGDFRYSLGNYFETEEQAREIINSKEWKDFWNTIKQEKEIVDGK